MARFRSIGMQSGGAAEETIEICKSSGRGREGTRSNGANVLSERNTYTSRFLELLSPFFFALSIVVGIGRRNSHYKTLVEIVTFQNGLRIMDPCIFIDTLKKYHCPFIFT